jgi:hypothetical protein
MKIASKEESESGKFEEITRLLSSSKQNPETFPVNKILFCPKTNDEHNRSNKEIDLIMCIVTAIIVDGSVFKFH